MIVTVRTILVALLKHRRVFPERLAAFLAHEHELG
jgi:hypothetical protein